VRSPQCGDKSVRTSTSIPGEKVRNCHEEQFKANTLLPCHAGLRAGKNPEINYFSSGKKIEETVARDLHFKDHCHANGETAFGRKSNAKKGGEEEERRQKLIAPIVSRRGERVPRSEVEQRN